MATVTIKFSADAQKEFQQILSECYDNEMAVIPTLHLCQREFGWISPEVMRYVASLLEQSPAQVLGVCSFYTMFHREPIGHYTIWVCSTLPCALCGSDTLFDHIADKLGIKLNETTDDGVFTLKKQECLGSCGTSPVVQINDDYHEGLTNDKGDRRFLRSHPRSNRWFRGGRRGYGLVTMCSIPCATAIPTPASWAARR